MSEHTKVTQDMTVREVNLRYPACREVFDKYGLGGCGGTYGPPEPIDFFARAHNAPLEDMLRDLNEAAEKGEAPVLEKDQETAAAKLCRFFVKAALILSLTLGTGWGVLKLTEIALGRTFQVASYAGTQAHGHAQLFGWAGLFIMGIAYFAVPRFMNATLPRIRLAFASFWLMLAGIIVRAAAQAHGPAEPFASLSVVSGVIELAAVIIFAWLMVETLLAKQGKREPFERYLVAGVVWFVIAMAANLWLAWVMQERGTAIIPAEYNPRFLHLVVFGFVVNIIFGVGLRILPNFLGLRQPLERLSYIALVLYNAGVLMRVIGLPGVLAGAHELAGALIFLHAIGVFTRPVVKVDIPGVDKSFIWFVRLAFGWLLITELMIFGADLYHAATGAGIPHAYVGAYRHAVTVGMITTLILGVGYRVLPIFAGTDLKMAWAVRATFFLIAVGNVMRVGFQLATMSGNDVYFALMGVSGYLELTAIAFFAVSIWRTMSEKEDAFLSDHVVRPSTKVANVLDLYPATRLLLISAGLTHLASIPKVPGFVTVGFAAKRHGIDQDEIVEVLNEFIKNNKKEEARVA